MICLSGFWVSAKFKKFLFLFVCVQQDSYGNLVFCWGREGGNTVWQKLGNLIQSKKKQRFSEFRKRTGRKFHGWNSRKDWTHNLKWWYYGYSPPPSSAQQDWVWSSFSPWMTGFTSSIFFHGRDPEKRKNLVIVSVKVPGMILVG